jgi:hypothetical protein
VKSVVGRGKSAILQAQIARAQGARGRLPINSFVGQPSDRGAYRGGRGRGDH